MVLDKFGQHGSGEYGTPRTNYGTIRQNDLRSPARGNDFALEHHIGGMKSRRCITKGGEKQQLCDRIRMVVVGAGARKHQEGSRPVPHMKQRRAAFDRNIRLRDAGAARVCAP